MLTISDHDFRPPRLTIQYALTALHLWFTDRISLATLLLALRHHPAAVAGKGGSHIIDQQAAGAYFGSEPARSSE
ncbi:hypothetical protein [Azospirillum sp. A29]|uniref:hypothetical protein n=1 Tax=unclassified Azospirillum TaxID=2630922 RepID=UPI00366B405D